MKVRPTKLMRAGEDLLGIEWSDGERRSYSAAELRTACPCAGCVAERSPAAPEGESAAGRVRVVEMSPVGNYAYRIVFSDGHSTGLYTFELLRRLGRVTKGPIQ